MSAEERLGEGISLRALHGIGSEALDTLYAFAHQRYCQHDYEGAREVFFALTGLDPERIDYWIATGMCYQQLQRHEEALECFVAAGMRAMTDPRPPYFAGVSLQMRGERAEAREAYLAAARCCGRQPTFAALKARAVAAAAVLEDQERNDGE